MSGGHSGDSNKLTFSSGNPHFFKIILQETLNDNKLRIPKDFLRKCGETPTNSVYVKLPCGSKWKMNLRKYDDTIWLEQGWPEFVKHYSIRRGHMLIFRYEGNSVFYAVIFDTSTIEIDYPYIPDQFDKSDSDIDLELRVPKEEVVKNDVEILEDLSPCPKAREKSQLPCSRPYKRMRTSPNGGETQSNSSCPKSKGFHPHESRANQVPPEESPTKKSFCKKFPGKQANLCKSTPLKTSQNTSTIGIDHPYIPDHLDKSDSYIDLELRAPRGKDVEDDFVEILDDLSPCLKAMEKSSSPCSRSHKRMRMSPNGKPDLPDESDRDKSTSATQREFWINRRMKALNTEERTAALKKTSAFKSECPFFKVVIQPCYVLGTRLSFSSKFASMYLKNVSNNVILKVTNGSKTWPVKYTFREHNGRITARFQRGWTKFVQDNHLEVGDVCVFVLLKAINVSFEVVLFRDIGNSKAPMSPAHEGRANQVPLEESLTKKSFAKRFPENQANGCKSTTWKTSQNTGKPDLPNKSDRDKSTGTIQRKLGINRCIKALNTKERIAALKKTSAFKSERPFFKVVIQPCHALDTRLPISSNFANMYLKTGSNNAILKVPNGSKTWPVKYTFRVNNGRTTARFQRCLTTFLQDNNLEAGDVCVFVLLKEINVSFEVVIFRGRGSSKAPMSPAHESGDYQVKLEESPTKKSFCKKVAKKQPNGYKSTPWKASQNTEPQVFRKQLSLTSDEKVRILKKAPFESDKPFFRVVMQPSYKCLVYVRLDLIERHIKSEGDVVLSIPSGRSWSAQLRKRSLKPGKFAAVISSGWKEFAEDNNLEVGDVCIFELLNGTKISFQVSIFRASDDYKHQESQAGDFAEGANKPKGDR